MLSDENLKSVFEKAVKNDATVELLAHLIDLSGCFRQGLAKDERTETYLRGFGDFGLYIRELFLKYTPEIYLRITKERVENDRRND